MLFQGEFESLGKPEFPQYPLINNVERDVYTDVIMYAVFFLHADERVNQVHVYKHFTRMHVYIYICVCVIYLCDLYSSNLFI